MMTFWESTHKRTFQDSCFFHIKRFLVQYYFKPNICYVIFQTVVHKYKLWVMRLVLGTNFQNGIVQKLNKLYKILKIIT